MMPSFSLFQFIQLLALGAAQLAREPGNEPSLYSYEKDTKAADDFDFTIDSIPRKDVSCYVFSFSTVYLFLNVTLKRNLIGYQELFEKQISIAREAMKNLFICIANCIWNFWLST